LDAAELGVAVVAAGAAFTVSAAAGLGGSLVLVPALVLVLDGRQGIALASLLLAANNIVKLVAYRCSVPWRRASGLAVLAAVGATVGAQVMVSAPENWVLVGALLALVAAFAFERGRFVPNGSRSERMAAGYSFVSGVTSGISGTSGPLKGVAVRSLPVDRLHLVGAASLVSMLGDLTKAAVFTDAGVLDARSFALAAALVPVMVAGTLFGRRLNRSAGEAGFTILFWSVMGGYSARLVVSLG
jgi:uncharacterized membrane protein YfcA